MRSLWPDPYASAASAACNAPSLEKKAPSAWLPPSSATNSFAARKKSRKFREVKSPASWLTAARSFAAAKNPQAELPTHLLPAATRFLELLSALAAGSILERFLGPALGKILDEFLARSLRRRAG